MSLVINKDGTMSRQRKEACSHCGSWTACDQCFKWTQFGIMRCPLCKYPNAMFGKYGAYTGEFLCRECGCGGDL